MLPLPAHRAAYDIIKYEQICAHAITPQTPERISILGAVPRLAGSHYAHISHIHSRKVACALSHKYVIRREDARDEPVLFVTVLARSFYNYYSHLLLVLYYMLYTQLDLFA